MSFSNHTTTHFPITRCTESTTRKRSRDDLDARDIDRRPFTISHDSSDQFSRPRAFTPITLLSRSQLPLAYLDTAQEGSRLFRAHLTVLETWTKQQGEATVLIVEDEREDRLYAIEHVQSRTYALCRLWSWVKRSTVTACETIGEQLLHQKKRRAIQPLENGKPWWAAATAVPDAIQPPVDAETPKLSILVVDQANPDAKSAGPPPTNTDVSVKDARETSEIIESQASATLDPLEELTKQYLDYLYHSRLPLTYFVKGPIARARAAFSAQPSDLLGFLRTATLSSSTMDKKYREAMPELIKEIPPLQTPEAKVKSKRKRKWKSKRDKAGFFVGEKENAETWWRNHDDSGDRVAPGETLDEAIRRRSPSLRNRETFLQVILILEAMALEATMPQLESVGVIAPGPPFTDSLGTEASVERKAPKKRQTDIAATLETLVDRLSIWFSLESSSPAKSKTSRDDLPDEDQKDDLISFATEVVVPFYAARIPDQAYTMSRKLGGPIAPTSARKPSSTSKRPGEPVARPVPEKKQRKPLKRVSTDTLAKSLRIPPSLHRSATDSETLAPLIKREMNDAPSLGSIPLSTRKIARSTGVPRKRVSLLEQASFSRREIDLSAMSQANEVKLRKKAEMDEKLRQVIDTIKKPNRDLAVEESAKNTDESFARAIAPKMKRSAHAQHLRKPAGKTTVAITATPRHIKDTPVRRHRSEHTSEEIIQSSNDYSYVPASSVKTIGSALDRPYAVPQTDHKSRYAQNVEDTPSRGFNRYLPAGLAREPGTLIDSPTANRTLAISQTPAKAIPMQSLMETPICKPPLLRRTYSPVKARLNLATVIGRSGSKVSGIGLEKDLEGQKSVYDVLGWDEAYEELT